MSTLPIPAALDHDLAQVGDLIAQRLRARPIVAQLADGAVPPDVRRSRAALVLLAAQLGGYELGRTLHAAAAVELIFVAFTLHERLVDQPARRREAVGAWPGVDGNVALMAGDYLLALAASEMAMAPDARIITYYSRSVMIFCEATLAPAQDGPPARAAQHYLGTAGASWASLFEAACKAGAVCGGLRQELVDQLGRFGHELGLALRLTADAEDYRSGGGAALRAGLVTSPLIYAAEARGAELLELADRVPAGLVSAADALAIVREAGGESRASAEARAHADSALALLAELPPSQAREALAAIARAAA